MALVEFFMRVQLRESVNEAGESDERMEAGLGDVRRAVDDLPWGSLGSDRNRIAEVTRLNGVPVLIAHGAGNHNRGYSDDLVDLLKLVGDVLPGSYGFAWYNDWEFNDGWKVYTLIRGEVAEQEDPWFSPIVPTVEDPSV